MRSACVLAALLAAVTAVAGCGSAPLPPRPARARPAPAPPRPPWPRFAEIMAFSPVTPGAIRAQGHLDVPPFAVTRVSPAARDAYLSLVTDSKLPPEALLAMTHQTSDGTPGPTFVMERRAAEWRYLVLDREGRVERDQPPECAGCHAGGVAEGLFGPPRPKETPATPRE